jgi:hypothetical protein
MERQKILPPAYLMHAKMCFKGEHNILGEATTAI